MLVPRLGLLPATVWVAAFGVAAAWFAWWAVYVRRGGADGWRCAYPVPHLVESVAMLYMILMMRGGRSAGPGPMPGMAGSSAAGVSFPALGLVLAIFMLGYVVWLADRLASLARTRTAVPARSAAPDRTTSLVAARAMAAASPQAAAAARAGTEGAWPRDPAGRATLAPRLAASYKIAMAVTMGYMLIMMV
ncbi:MAG: DUF5134 domain-containing protein [Actinomycetota bacterium]|nr:DUF5134 domain-containing protein [Actinomycetota bacterium]